MMHVGKIIIFIGVGLVLIGGLVIFFERLGVHLGRLPGDIMYRKGNTTVYFPIVTSILLSLLLSVIFWLLKK